MYAWPLRPPALAWLGMMALASVLVDLAGWVHGIFALVLGAMWWLMAFKLASEALTLAASGREHDEGFEVFASDGNAMRQVMLGLGLIAIGALLHLFAPPAALWAFGIALALMLPAMVVIVVMEDSLLRAFDPRMWFELLRRIGGAYLALALQLALLAVAVVLALRVLPAGLPSPLAEGLAHALVLYLMLVAYHALGVLLDDNREALELEREGPTERPAGVTREETAAVAECERLLAADQPAEAAAVLDRLIRGRGATAPVHARYRALLSQRGDVEGLLRHARDYVAVLLQLGQEREALALYLESRHADPAFELGDPQPISELLALAGRNQQSQLAVALWEEFARRFPRDRDLVLNGLTAARLMDRLGRDDEARALLLDLLRRFPEHSLREQLQASLAGIDAARAR
jgi:hypothetical protein